MESTQGPAYSNTSEYKSSTGDKSLQVISKFVNTSNESYYKVGQQRVKKFTGLSVQQDAPEQEADGAGNKGSN